VTVNAVDAFDVTEIERLDDERNDVVVWLLLRKTDRRRTYRLEW
jgi:hypothetical protein